jgi:Ca2+-transporting ATPase
LYINIVTDTFPALALGVSPAEGNIMRQPPRDPEEPLLDKEMIIMIFTSGVSYAIGALFVYFWATDFTLTTDSAKLHTAQTMVFVSLVIYQLLHSLSLSQKDIIFNKQFFKNGKLFLAVLVSTALLLVAIYVPFLSNFIETQPLEALHWGIIFLTALPIFIIDEGRKMILKAVKKRAYEKQKQKIE